MGLQKILLTFLFAMIFSFTGCGTTQQTPNRSHVATTVKVPTSTIPSSVRDTANAILSLYRDRDVPDPSMLVKQTWTDSDHQKMYLVSATGSFRKSFHGSVATKISFSILADGSKAWALVATNGEGKELWKQDSFLVKPITLRYAGSGHLWHGTYEISGVRLINQRGVRVNSWEQDEFKLHYTGKDNPSVSSITYSVNDSVGGDSGSRQNVHLKSETFAAGGGGNGIFPPKAATPKVSVQWDGHTETFLLHPLNP